LFASFFIKTKFFKGQSFDMMETTTTLKQHRKMLKTVYAKLPLVYSCSGCSSVAQLANKLAVRLDREMLAEMSCIAGVGGNVKPLVKTAKSQRPIIALDGCPLQCVRHSLANHGIKADVHLDLSKYGIKKRFHEDATPEEETLAWNEVILPAVEKLHSNEHPEHYISEPQALQTQPCE
jgi:uncharacterized metal-binding protein